MKHPVSLPHSFAGRWGWLLTLVLALAAGPALAQNNALNFDGNDDAVSIPNAPALNLTTALTIEAWIKPVGTGESVQNVVCKSSNSQNTGYIFPRTDNTWTNLEAYLNVGGGWQVITVPYAAYVGTWHHTTLTYDNSMVRIYIDGTQVLAQALTGAVAVNTNTLTLGNQPGYSEHYRGDLDQVRVYNAALTAAQVQAEMYATSPALPANHMLGFSFNQGTAGGNNAGVNTLIDQSSNGLNGTLINFALTGSTSNWVAGFPAPPTLTVSTGTVFAPTLIPPGTYSSIVVTSTGVGALAGPVSVTSGLTVNGILGTNCQAITGAGTFTLNAGGTLGICDPAGISASGASGAVQVTGTRTYSTDANYLYNGITFQSTGPGLPNTVRGLGSNNPNSVTLSHGVNVTQGVAIGSTGNISLDGLPLRLLSDASGTALVANVGTGVILGNTVTMQRYIGTNTAANGYRHYASPMAAGFGGETVNTLATAGYSPNFSGATAYNTSPTPGTVTPFPTVFSYNQDRIDTTTSNYSTFDKGWQAAVSGEAMPPGKGFAVQAPGSALVDFTGSVTNGPVTRSGLKRASADPNTGWHLLGNPYPAPLNWSTMTIGAGQSLENMDGAMYVFQSSGPYSGSYRTYLAAAPGANSPIIPAGAGFFAHASTPGTPGTVRFTNANRVTSFAAQPAFGRSNDQRPTLTLALAGASGPADELTLYADPAATAGVDAAFDAVKLPNPSGLNLATLTTAGTALAIDGRPSLAASIPLSVTVPAAGSYTFSAAALAHLAGTRAELVDNLTGTRTLLTAGATYRFTTTTTSAAGRFWLNLTSAGALASAAAALEAQVMAYPNPAHGTLTVLRPANTLATPALLQNALGQVVRRVALPTAETTVDLSGLASGVYSLRFTLDGQPLTRRVVLD